ncbi:serine/threonine-protein kinase [Nocardia arthritidis]|uniref:Protein kinase n=1 Tax=Nocardia arthritidis TaxID=228602 RepID=A0A6G9YEY8_9NOCA|nr:serine/threonine-protein kinase [Nocardia arthritidis]QIS11789.1 protein kinase [Nocardia arthritidis]
MRPLGADDPVRIGDYRLLGLLGVGGMGRVYLGRNAGGRTVAVKVVRPELVADAQSRERFRREVAAARLVGGQFTAPVLDADVDAEPPWLATGYVAGLSLSDAVEGFGVFGESTLLVLARGLLEALVAVHSAGIVHRDLKPSNVLLAIDGPKVIDFGIARAVTDAALTTTGKVIGSPGFMCPEQITGQPVGPAGDLFSFAGVLVFAASGHGPFGTAETMQLMWRVMYEDPRLEQLPDRLRPMVAACLAKDPENRPTTKELLDDLGRLDIPDAAGWLPGPVVEEVGRRAIRLLDLDSGPHPTTEPEAAQPDSSRIAPTQRSVPIAAPQRVTGWPDSNPVESRSDTGTPGFHTTLGSINQYPPSRPQPSDQPASPPAAPHSARLRAAVIAGAAVVAAAVAVAAFVVGSHLTGGSSAGSTSTATQAPGTTAAPVTAAASSPAGQPVQSVPQAFVGEWKGTASDALAVFDIVLTVRDGNVGAEVATSSNTGHLSGAKCERAETLTAATERQLSFTARLTGGLRGAFGCHDEGETSTVVLQPDGSLAYTTAGGVGDIRGTLQKS